MKLEYNELMVEIYNDFFLKNLKKRGLLYGIMALLFLYFKISGNVGEGLDFVETGDLPFITGLLLFFIASGLSYIKPEAKRFFFIFVSIVLLTGTVCFDTAKNTGIIWLAIIPLAFGGYWSLISYREYVFMKGFAELNKNSSAKKTVQNLFEKIRDVNPETSDEAISLTLFQKGKTIEYVLMDFGDFIMFLIKKPMIYGFYRKNEFTIEETGDRAEGKIVINAKVRTDNRIIDILEAENVKVPVHYPKKFTEFKGLITESSLEKYKRRFVPESRGAEETEDW